MITLYSGTPGSGKSLHLAREVADELGIRRKNVIANFPINMSVVDRGGKRKTGKFIYLTNDKITVNYLIRYAQDNHVVGKEGQTLLVIDEAGIMFNSRDYGAFDRKSWIQFFMTHRHYGFNVILVSQSDRMIDRQIRAFIEYDIKHRKANNFRFIGFLLTVMHIPIFAAITYWYGMRERIGSEIFRYRKRDSKLYDTMMLFGGLQHGTRAGKDVVEGGCEPFSGAEDSPRPAALDGDGDTGSAGGDPSRPDGGTAGNSRPDEEVPIAENKSQRLSAWLRKARDFMNRPLGLSTPRKKPKDVEEALPEVTDEELFMTEFAPAESMEDEPDVGDHIDDIIRTVKEVLNRPIERGLK